MSTASTDQARRSPPSDESDYVLIDLADTQISNHKLEPSERLPAAVIGAELPVDVPAPAEASAGTPAQPARPANASKEPSRSSERGSVDAPAVECLEAIAGGLHAPKSPSDSAQVAAGNCRRR